VSITLPVTPETKLYIYVGGRGGTNQGSVWFNVGGSGVIAYFAKGGQRLSDIRIGGKSLANRMVVPGPGGGTAAGCNGNSHKTVGMGWFDGDAGQCRCGGCERGSSVGEHSACLPEVVSSKSTT
jgi:hypothetical protein